MKIYISGALNGSRDLSAARAIYKKAAEVITIAGHEPYLPHKKTDPESAAHLEAKAVFHADLIEIHKSHGVVAFLNEPSFGVGAEIAICYQKSIPLLGLCEKDMDVSRFVVGCLLEGQGRLVRYSRWAQASEAISTFLSELQFSMPIESDYKSDSER